MTSSFLGSLRRTQVRLDDDTIVSVQHDVERAPRIGRRGHAAVQGSRRYRCSARGAESRVATGLAARAGRPAGRRS